jgi:integrase
MAAGIERRGNGYRAKVWSARDGKPIRKTFPTLAAAKAWRHDALVALQRGELRTPTTTTVTEAAKAWVEGARRGAIRTRSGDPYKHAAIRAYERALRLRILPALGSSRLSDVRRGDVQDLVDELVASGQAASTIQITIATLQAIYRRELHRGRLAVNPAAGLELPAVRNGRDRVADPAEAATLLAALPERDRAVWATAMYGGLRRGELQALQVDRIDLSAGVIHVDYGWDVKEGRIETKGRNRRRVPIPAVLRDHLLEHLMRTGRRGRDLVFGKTAVSPFSTAALSVRADRVWKEANLRRITLHECRHTYASYMIAAGVNAKALSSYLGHAGIAITLDRYGHLMPGNEEEAAGLLDSYLERENAQATVPRTVP